MKTRFFIIYAAFFLVISAAVCGTILCSAHHIALPQHTTEINRLLIRISDEWEHYKNTDRPPSIAADFDYAVLDKDGTLLFATRRGISESVSAATSHYDIIREIEKDGETVGRLLVYNPYEEITQADNQKTALMTGSLSLLMLAVSAGFFLYLKKRVVEPFGQLEGFAEKIAGGNLDTPLEMDKGNVFGAFTGSFDIMREELKASRQREEAAVRSRREMIAELSHDIKTPVASIKAMSEFLALTAENADQKETLLSVNKKADQIDRLISNLFHATLEELEQLEVHSEELSSADVVQIISESDHLRKVTHIDIAECVIMADRLRLEQIIGNILSNSYKYADTEITVDSRFDGSSLVVEISDSGGGLPDHEIELITEKFRRGSNAAGKDGSGIGLYISKYFMEKTGGGLSCRNNGKGFTVELRFRLA